MNAEEQSTSAEENLTPLLVACENALAAGTLPPDFAGKEVPPELRPRLERGLACMQLLRKVLPSPLAETAASADLPLTSLGRFLIRREVGRGAFGVVFLAHDPSLGRDVALKVPRPEALVPPELRQRFVREARAAAGLDHPNLVAVHEAGEAGPICYIASAYCPGVTLGAWLKGCGDPVPARVAAQLVAMLAEAVQHAHSHGVIHRDLKPNNVLLQTDFTAEDAESAEKKTKKNFNTSFLSSSALSASSAVKSLVPKITDFGLAKYMLDAPAGAEDPTQSGAVMGTPSYMAPEQASGKNKQVGPAADVYGLGAILYEVLVGRPPFQGDTSLDTLEQVRSREPVPPRCLRPKLSRDLETICLKCLHKEPAKRYTSAQALADDLRRFLAGEPIRARPTGRAERLWRWCRRKPALASLTAALVLLFLGSFVALTGLWLRAEEHRRWAEKSDRQNREVVNKFFTLVSEETLLNEPGLQPLRKKLLENALEYYRSFIRQRGDDPKLRAELADANQRLGSLLNMIGSKADALAAFKEALRLREQLVRENPTDRQLRGDLAQSYRSLGDLQSQMGHPDEALRFYEAALAIQEKLVREDPMDARLQGSLAWTYHNISDVHDATGQSVKALSCYKLAHAIRKQLVRDHPDVAQYRCDLAISHNGIDNHQSTDGKFAETLQSYQEARAIQEEVVKNNPANLDFQRALAMIHYNIGLLHARSGRPKEAFASCEEAHKLYKKLAGANPAVPTSSVN